jgi:hypothetical protein
MANTHERLTREMISAFVVAEHNLSVRVGDGLVIGDLLDSWQTLNLLGPPTIENPYLFNA